MNSFSIDFNQLQTITLYESFAAINHQTEQNLASINNFLGQKRKYDIPLNYTNLSQNLNNEVITYEEPLQPKKMQCKCRNSYCLKHYCDCFAAGQFCIDCYCINCKNTESNLQEIMNIKEAKSKKNKYPVVKEEVVFCKCTNSECQKKYCECFKAGLECTSTCRCINCSNTQLKSNDKNKTKSKVLNKINSQLYQFINNNKSSINNSTEDIKQEYYLGTNSNNTNTSTNSKFKIDSVVSVNINECIQVKKEDNFISKGIKLENLCNISDVSFKINVLFRKSLKVVKSNSYYFEIFPVLINYIGFYVYKLMSKH